MPALCWHNKTTYYAQSPQPAKKKSKKSKVNRKNASESTTNKPAESHLKPADADADADVGSPAKPANLLDHSPIVAHHEPELNLLTVCVSEAGPISISECSICTV